MTVSPARDWATVEEHIASTLPSHPSQQEEHMSSPFTAALGFVSDQAAVLEADVNANPLSVILAARHVGRSFSTAQCIAIADFLAQLDAENRARIEAENRARIEAENRARIEAENRARQQALDPYQDGMPVNGTGPQRVLQ